MILSCPWTSKEISFFISLVRQSSLGLFNIYVLIASFEQYQYGIINSCYSLSLDLKEIVLNREDTKDQGLCRKAFAMATLWAVGEIDGLEHILRSHFWLKMSDLGSVTFFSKHKFHPKPSCQDGPFWSNTKAKTLNYKHFFVNTWNKFSKRTNFF